MLAPLKPQTLQNMAEQMAEERAQKRAWCHGLYTGMYCLFLIQFGPIVCHCTANYWPGMHTFQSYVLMQMYFEDVHF